MILYHFTAMENVEAIQRDGLRALLQGSHDSFTILGTCDKPAVYLTDTPTINKLCPNLKTLEGASVADDPVARSEILRRST